MNLRYPAIALSVVAIGAVGVTAVRTSLGNDLAPETAAVSVVGSTPADDWPDEGTGYPGYGETASCG